MKFFLHALFITLLAIPVLSWLLLEAAWSCKSYKLKTVWNNYLVSLEYDYRRIFPYRSKKRK